MIRAWRSGGFLPGPPATPVETPSPGAPDATFTPTLASASTPRCYRLGELSGRVSHLRVTAQGIAWVEVFAIAPALATLLPDLEAADAAPGWTCGDEIGLVPQPLVAAWQLGDGLVDLSASPTHIPPSTLVARVAGGSLSASLTGPTATIELWLDQSAGPSMHFVPALAPSTLDLPWLDPSATLTTLAATYSSGATESLTLGPSACLHDRPTRGAWPELTTHAPQDRVVLAPGDRLELTCHPDLTCAAQVGLVGDPNPVPCPASVAACRGACGHDLACAWTCAAETGRRCATCLLTGQLACHAEACAATARDRLESCIGTQDPTSCIAGSVFDALDACPAPRLCDLALDACFAADSTPSAARAAQPSPDP